MKRENLAGSKGSGDDVARYSTTHRNAFIRDAQLLTDLDIFSCDDDKSGEVSVDAHPHYGQLEEARHLQRSFGMKVPDVCLDNGKIGIAAVILSSTSSPTLAE